MNLKSMWLYICAFLCAVLAASFYMLFNRGLAIASEQILVDAHIGGLIRAADVFPFWSTEAKLSVIGLNDKAVAALDQDGQGVRIFAGLA
jgi:hypothetical protein